MNKSDVAVQCLTSGFNCAQAVFSTYCSELGLKPEIALRIAGGFGGGMGISETLRRGNWSIYVDWIKVWKRKCRR